MQIADFHLHSKYSRACSKDLDIKNLEKWGRIKGVDILGTSDYTHPKWITELKTNLTEDPEEKGIYVSEGGQRFILSTEISLMYSEGGRGRRIHNVILAPSFEVVDQITEYLLTKGRIDYDGRPIFKIPCDEFTYELKKISNDVEIIPAHCLTPWFSIFGSSSGYDTVKDCFKDQTKHIHALETGMSADPAMIYRVADWRQYALISNSDSHSFWPWRMGREATLFNMKKISYLNMVNAIRNKELAGTIEVDPSYGKYHFTGHRKCHFVTDPATGIKIGNICPVCHSKLTVGVQARVEELADKPEGYYPEWAPKFYSFVPLSELISGFYKYPVASKKTWAIYNSLVKDGVNEFDILLHKPVEELNLLIDPKLAAIIMKNRDGKIKVKPGFDGVYGIPLIHGDEEYNFEIAGDDEEKPKKEKVIKEKVIKEKKTKPLKESSRAKTATEQAALDKFF